MLSIPSPADGDAVLELAASARTGASHGDAIAAGPQAGPSRAHVASSGGGGGRRAKRACLGCGGGDEAGFGGQPEGSVIVDSSRVRHRLLPLHTTARIQRGHTHRRLDAGPHRVGLAVDAPAGCRRSLRPFRRFRFAHANRDPAAAPCGAVTALLAEVRLYETLRCGGQTVRRASVGAMRDARSAGYSPAIVPTATAASSPPHTAVTGTSTVQPCCVA